MRDKKSPPPRIKGGFDYFISDEVIDEYLRWPPEERLHWLTEGTRLHCSLPDEIRKIHDLLRKGEKL